MNHVKQINTRLSINVNKIALIRNSRGGLYPSVVDIARRCLDGGADGITVHPREDQRHIRYQDVYDLALLLKEYPEAEFNVEGTPNTNLIHVVLEVKPNQCTLVPDSPDQLTSDHGWDVHTHEGLLTDVISKLHNFDIRVSLFVDSDEKRLDKVRSVGADRVELYTGPYAEAFGTGSADAVLSQYVNTSQVASTEGLGVNAGHDLNQKNLGNFLTQLHNVEEVSIGHAFFCECLEEGLDKTLASYRDIICGASL